MKKLVKFTFIAFISLFFVACGDNNPKGATEKFYNSILNGNVDDFKKYSTIEVQNGFKYLCGQNTQDDKELSKCLKDDIAKNFLGSYKIVDVKENGSTSAIVVLEIYKDNSVRKEEAKVEKISNEWKVDKK